MAGSLAAVVVVSLTLASTVSAETLLWHDEFDTLDLGVWNHLVTAWRGGNNEFEYYRNNRKNRYCVQNINNNIDSYETIIFWLSHSTSFGSADMLLTA